MIYCVFDRQNSYATVATFADMSKASAAALALNEKCGTARYGIDKQPK